MADSMKFQVSFCIENAEMAAAMRTNVGEKWALHENTILLALDFSFTLRNLKHN